MNQMQGSGFWAALKRFLLWDHARASWQYDVMVGLILAFIFLTPRDVFRDQPKPKNIVQIPAEEGLSVFWMEPDLLLGVDPEDQALVMEKLLHSQAGGRNRRVVRLEPIFDDEKEIRGYMVYTRP